MSLAKASPFNVFAAYNFFAFVITSSKLWFTWLWYNIACKIFMFFNMSIEIVKFVMIWKLTPFLTRLLAFSTTSLSRTFSFYYQAKYFLIKQHILKAFILCFVRLFTQNPIFVFHLFIWPIWFILIIQISALSCAKIQGHRLIILGFALVLHETFFMLFKLDLMGVPLCSFF